MSFTNKVVIITGASSGIGAATALLFSKEGADVVIVGRNEQKLNGAGAACAKYGKKLLVIKADICKENETKSIIDSTIKKYGKIDILVNNAGFAKEGSLLDGKIMEAYDAVMLTNVRAVIYLTSLAAPHLIKTKGNVINISSVASVSSIRSTMTPYCISKAAVDHFTRGAAKELAESGVRVNSVNPGPVRTNFLENSDMTGEWDQFKETTALKRVSDAEEIGELIMFLASNKARGITGSCYFSDNGFLLCSSMG